MTRSILIALLAFSWLWLYVLARDGARINADRRALVEQIGKDAALMRYLAGPDTLVLSPENRAIVLQGAAKLEAWTVEDARVGPRLVSAP